MFSVQMEKIIKIITPLSRMPILELILLRKEIPRVIHAIPGSGLLSIGLVSSRMEEWSLILELRTPKVSQKLSMSGPEICSSAGNLQSNSSIQAPRPRSIAQPTKFGDLPKFKLQLEMATSQRTLTSTSTSRLWTATLPQRDPTQQSSCSPKPQQCNPTPACTCI